MMKMKKKTYLAGGLITGVIFCAVVLFNSFGFPAVLAMTSEDETVHTAIAGALAPEAAPAEEISAAAITRALPETEATGAAVTEDSSPAEDVPDSDMKPDINAISAVQAAKAAAKGLERYEYVDPDTNSRLDFNTLPYTTQYIPGAVPANKPIWVVVFKQVIKERKEHVRIVDYASLEEMEEDYGSKYKIEGEDAVFEYTDHTVIHFISIDALTGDYIRSLETTPTPPDLAKEVAKERPDEVILADKPSVVLDIMTLFAREKFIPAEEAVYDAINWQAPLVG